MSTLVTNRKIMLKGIKGYMVLTLFCLFFNYGYGLFGHGVHSDSMTYAFMIPLILGVVVCVLLMIFRKNYIPHRYTYRSYNMGMATIVVGSIVKGICDIAGTSSKFLIIYAIVGGLLMFVGIITSFLKM